MNISLITDQFATPLPQAPATLPDNGFLWLDATHDEVLENPDSWRDAITSVTGVQIYDLHLKDILNLYHPSYFDSAQDYSMIVFRNLTHAQVPVVDHDREPSHKIPPALSNLSTAPVAFVLMERALITIHPKDSRTINATLARLLTHAPSANSHGSRLPTSPEELALRLLNTMVDQYLELRQPLSTQLDRWQRALLNPRRAFNDWMALLDARNELHKLDRLCEEQHDALQELRDHLIDSYGNDETDRTNAKDLLLVRVNDVMEHVTRVLNHARRLESSLESAVQIHFASVSHRTSEVMRTLTVITALFMPLTLITGIFGMNFIEMPLLKNGEGFWIAMGAMALIVVGLLLLFRNKRYLES